MGAHQGLVTLLEDVSKSLSDGYSFGYGAATDFNSLPNRKYPFIWLDPIQGNFQTGESTLNNVIVWNISLNFLDLDQTGGNEKETAVVWDETFGIMQKYIHKLDLFLVGEMDTDTISTDNIRYVNSPQFVPRRKGTADHVTGWTLTFQLETFGDFDYCSIYE